MNFKEVKSVFVWFARSRPISNSKWNKNGFDSAPNIVIVIEAKMDENGSKRRETLFSNCL